MFNSPLCKWINAIYIFLILTIIIQYMECIYLLFDLYLQNLFILFIKIFYNNVDIKNNKGMKQLYITVKEAAEYLNIPESYIEELVQQKRIRAVYDGEQYLLNKEQFNTHLEQMEKYKQLVEEILNEPIPEDMDVKDED